MMTITFRLHRFHRINRLLHHHYLCLHHLHHFLPPPQALTNFQPPPPPPIFSQPAQNNTKQPINFTQQPNIGAATKFGELEAVKGEQGIARENIKNEIDDLMREIPSSTRLELSDGILNFLNDAEDIINKDLIREKDLEEKVIEDIKREHNFEDIKNTLDEGYVHEILEFFTVET